MDFSAGSPEDDCGFVGRLGWRLRYLFGQLGHVCLLSGFKRSDIRGDYCRYIGVCADSCFVDLCQILGAKLNLAGLSAMHLLVLSTVSAGLAAIMHNAYFMMLGKVDEVVSSTGAMFVGDFVGTLIVLYGAKWVLYALISKSAAGAA